jgi:hypothetical protein
MPSARFSVVLRLLLPLILCGTVFAQKDTGSIVGTVKDPTGAVVTGASVEVTDVERGQTFRTKTSDAGEFVASPLRVGRYTVTVEKAGFKKAVSETVELNVQGRVAVNIGLQVGQQTEEVIVTGAAPLLETETSELGQVVDRRRVSNLPLNGRNFAQLALLSTGTAPSEPGARDEGGYGFSANGARSLQNNFLLDGVDNNSNLPDLLNESNYVIQPPVEALQEFKVQTNAYGAEFGRGNGAIVNAVIKSGTNSIHGSAWEFIRNNKFDSRNYFDPVGQPAPQYQQNQFGATFGGPVVIPHLYDGRNRTFFFVDYEGLRVRQAQTQVAFVPPTAWRTGDFSSLIDYTSVTGTDCNNRPTYTGEIFDAKLAQNIAPSPIAPPVFCGVPFQYDSTGKPLNIIPKTPVVAGGGSLDPLALRLAALYPAAGPTDSGGNNFVANPVLKKTRNNFDVRVDQKFTDKDNTFFRFSYEDQPSFIPGTFGGLADGGGFFSGDEEFSYRSFATSWTHVFKPEIINEFRLGYNRINAQRLQLNANTNVSAQPDINFPGVPFSPGIGGLPQLNFNDVATLGSPTFLPSIELQNSYTLAENLTWVRGRHTLKFGTEIRREEFTINQPAAPRGTLNFDSTLSDNPAAAAIGSGGTGFASFMAGLTSGGSINNLHNVDYFRNTYAFYGQDDWKVTPDLVLNLGLRYELFGTVSDRFNDIGNFDLSNPASPTIFVPKGQTAQLTPFIAQYVKISPTGSRGLINSDLNNFAPRIGLAWQFTPKTVLRAGYGVFYGGQENGPYSNPSPGFNPPFFVNESFIAPCGAPTASTSAGDCRVANLQQLSQGFPANSLSDPNTPIFFSVDKNLRTPYMQQWHVGFEREMPGNSVFAMTYAGSKGTKLYTFFNGNQAEPTADPSAATAPRRPVFASIVGKGPCNLTTPDNCTPVFDTGIDWFRSTGNSSYHSLQLRYEKRFSKGLQFQASYTYAHSLDIASNANLGPTQNNSDFRDFRIPQQEYGNSDFDVRHRFVINSIYELPFGHGKHFMGNATGVANAIVGGWQIANIISISSGNWYTVLDSNGNFANADGGAGGVSQRPDQVGDPNRAGTVAGNPGCQAPSKIHAPTAWFNTCAFVDPAQGSFGNVGRNTIESPGIREWDFSVFKFFQTSERTNLEFRAEFFNLPNHTNFLFANTGPQNGNNATILGTPQFGALTAARAPRQIQLAMKFSF